MGLLYQVLKDVSEKQPYKVGKEQLKEIVRDLKINVSTGREGFKVIEQVAQRVGEYNESVKQSNDDMKTIINNMNNDMKTLQNEVGKILQNNADSENLDEVKQAEESVTMLAEDYAKKGMNFDSKFYERKENAWNKGSKAEPKQQFKDLNADLRLKITHARKNITHEAERLTTMSAKQKDNLAAMTSKISNKLKTLKSCVNERILKDVNELVKKLNDTVQRILEQLVMIRQKLQGYVEKLRKWIRDADEIVTDCMKTAENIEKKHVAWAAEDEIKESLKEINKSFGEAKDFVKQELNKALGKVRDMDEAIKKDLFTVKKNIKQAVKALGEKMEADVRDGLWKIEEAITTPLGVIVQGAQGFDKEFRKTKDALNRAIQIASDDLGKLWNLTEFEHIKGAHGNVVASPLLKAVAEGVALQPVITYLDNLDKHIMQNVKTAMQNIGEKWQSAFTYEIETHSAQSLRKLVDTPSSMPTFDPKAFQKYGIDMTRDIRQLNIQMQSSSILRAVGGSNGKPLKIEKAEVTNILSNLGAIGAAVAKHSKDIVEKVIRKIQEKVDSDITELAQAVQGKVGNVLLGINHDRENRDFDYYVGSEGKAKGLKALVNNFDKHIKQALTELQQTVNTKVFLHTDSSRRSIENYVFGEHLMTAFKKTHDDNLKDGDIKTEGGTGDKKVLDEEIGPNNLPNGGSSRDKISSIAKSNFTNYDTHVNQESLGHSDPQKLEGALPTAIKDIRDYGLQLFEQKLGANQNVDDISSGFLKDITVSLSGLMQALERTGKSLNVALRKLKNEKIGMTTSGAAAKSDTLQELEKNLLQLFGVDLDQVINDATAFKQQADDFRNKTIRDLDRYVEDEVKKAENALITQANKTYVTSVKEMLQAFADKVQKELQPLPGEIDTDRQHGFKGFMRTLEGRIDGDETTQDNIDRLKGLVDQLSRNVNHKEAFKNLSQKFKEFCSPLHVYLRKQIARVHAANQEKINPKPTGAEQLYTSKLEAANTALNTLLDHIHTHNRYNHKVPEMLDSLRTKVDGLHPESFSEPNTPLLDGIGKGLREFASELGKAYVSRYDGGEGTDKLSNLVITKSNSDGNSGTKDELTDDGRNLSKVFLTILEILFYDFETLKKLLSGNNGNKINSGTALGKFFSERGYNVATKDGVQDGELDNSSKTTGTQINNLRDSAIQDAKGTSNKLHGCIIKLCNDLIPYYNVCHYEHIKSPKAATSINEMLHWLAGLCYHPMFEKLNTRLVQFFNKPLDNGKTETKNIEVALPHRRSVKMLRSLTHHEIAILFSNITIRSYHILVAIQGHGHADGRYACDFLSNPDGLLYPTGVEQCLDTLVDVCLRLNEQLCFLYKQCQNGPERGGWRDCHYGKEVGGSSWRCNDIQCADQTCNQTRNQIHNQSSDQNPSCGLKSPLHSFLEDGLPGFLPHQFKTPGCKLECTLSNHRGIPCKTPMGFKHLSQVASRIGTGQRIRDVLERLFGKDECSLSLMCSYLTCLLRKPPQTLGDMFAFYYNFLDHWDKEGKEHKKTAFDQAVNSAYFGAEYTQLDVTKVLASKEHKDDNHPKGDLFGILYCDPETTSYPPCGRYLQSISDDIRLLYSKKHAGIYLSWIVYMTETFYDLLKKLYDDCCKKCGNGGSKCHTKCCIKSCKVKYAGDDGKAISPLEDAKHDKKCSSIVKCQDTHPTLYTYGFTFGSPYKLSGATNYEKQKRTCKDLCEALKIILGKDSALIELRHQIDNFLWAIREYFSYTALALWSASFLYLLYVYIGRLDTLHIRSHLRIPSSHKIAAQSLLAAARIGKLAKISYLQP